MKKVHVWLFVIVFFLSSCGNKPQENIQSADGDAVEWWEQVEQASQSDPEKYLIREKGVPYPDEPLLQELEPEWVIFQNDLRMCNGVVWRVAYITDSSNNVEKTFLQQLTPPYEEWITVDVTEPVMVQVDGNIRAWYVDRVIGESDGAVYFTVKPWQSAEIYLGRYDGDGFAVVQMLTDITDEMADMDELWSGGTGRVCFYGENCGSVLMLAEDFLTKEQISLPNHVQTVKGLIWNPQRETVCCVGTVGGKPGVWTLEEGESLLTDFKGDTFDPNDWHGFGAAIDNEGSIYLANSQEIWRYDGQSELLLRFQEQDYIITEIFAMEAEENGNLKLLANVDGKTCVLWMQESEGAQTAKEEVVIALLSEDKDLQRAVIDFNRQSDKYHVTLNVLLDDDSLYGGGNAREEVCTRIQLLISAGEGPDILDSAFVPDDMLEAYVAKGILCCVDDVLEDGQQYFQAAFERGMVDGRLYGIPYDCNPLNYAVYSQSFAGGRTSWTLNELMEAARASDAKILEEGLRGFFIVRNYGLYDVGNTAFIDWEKGESHLDEKPFIEFLEFAKEYADDREYGGQKVGEETVKMLASGELLAIQSGASDLLRNTNYLKTCFAGEPAMLGYPRTEGNGIYVYTFNLYLNESAQCKEGAKEFLRFLISEDEQRRLVTKSDQRDMSIISIPVNLGALDTYIATSLSMLSGDANSFVYSYNGISYEVKGLTDEDIETFRWLIAQAHPHDRRVSKIISFASEELEPFFSGTVSAEEAARKLDNRVQLYLDERK